MGTKGSLRIILNTASSSSIVFQLTASDSNISIPASVTIPAGANSQDVSFQIGSGFDSTHVFALTAQLATESHTAYGTQMQPGPNTGFIAALQSTVAPVVVAGGTTPDYGLLIQSLGGYSTQITVTCSGLPSGASCQISPNPASLPAGGVIAVTVMVATQPGIADGQYPFTVNLTDGVVTKNLSATLNVGDFALSITPAAQTLGPTDFTSFTLNAQSINGYSQTLQITCSGLPTGTTCPFAAAVFEGANYFQVQTQNAPLGSYTFTLTGTSGGLVHSASAQLTVTGGTFSGSVSPNSATITVGTSKSFAVQVNASGGFQGQVNLSCNAASGLICQLTPNQLTLPSNGSASSTLQITINSKPAIIPFVVRVLRRPPTQVVWFTLLILLITALANRVHFRRNLSLCRPAWSPTLLLGGLLLFLLTIASCGGGSSIGGGSGGGGGNGGGGGGGGGGTITSVTVQGSAGGTTVSLGPVSVTIP